MPSIVALSPLAPSGTKLTSLRTSSSVSGADGIPQETMLTIGNRSEVPRGTVQLRVTSPPPVPARNQTLPSCMFAQKAPVVSRMGFVLTGCESAQVHQAAAHSL